MELPEAVEIYLQCQASPRPCDGCPLSEKKRFGDRSICSLLFQAETKAKEVKDG